MARATHRLPSGRPATRPIPARRRCSLASFCQRKCSWRVQNSRHKQLFLIKYKHTLIDNNYGNHFLGLTFFVIKKVRGKESSAPVGSSWAASGGTNSKRDDERQWVVDHMKLWNYYNSGFSPVHLDFMESWCLPNLSYRSCSTNTLMQFLDAKLAKFSLF